MNRIRAIFLYLGKSKTVWKIFILGLVIRVGITLFLGERLLPLADQPVFLDMAEHIAAGDGIMVSQELVGVPEWISDSLMAVLKEKPERKRDAELNALWGIVKPNTPTAFIQPLYPAFLGVIRYVFGPTHGIKFGLSEVIHFGPKITVVRLFQSLFDAMVILLLYNIGAILLTPATGGVAALIYCFYPYSIIFITDLVTQSTYLFLQALTIFFFVRTLVKQSWGNYLFLGLCAGLTLLTRISFIAFIPFIIIGLFLPLRRNLKWGHLTVSLSLIMLLIAPWLLRNWIVFGEPFLLPTEGGRVLWEYSCQIFTPEMMEGEKTSGIGRMYQQFALKNYDHLKKKELLTFPKFTDESEIERNRILNARVWDFNCANPWIYAQLCGVRFYQLFRITPTQLGGPLATVVSLASWGWILPASVGGLILSFRRWRVRFVIYAIIFCTVMIHTLTASGIPYRFPIDPYFILLAAFFLVQLLKVEREENAPSDQQELV